MKSIKICLLLFSFLMFSCEKENDVDPGCDINGVWIGNWDTNASEEGTFLANIEQELNRFNGRLALRILSDHTQSFSSDISGSVENKNINSVIDISGVLVSVEGNVQNDNSVSGNYAVSQLDMAGSFSGTKLKSSKPELKEIYAFEQSGEESIVDILCIDNELWLIKGPSVYVNDQAMLSVLKLDFEGNIIGESFFPGETHGYSYDGTHIWSISYYSELKKYDKSGTLLDTKSLPLFTSGLACDGENFYFEKGVFTILKTNMQLQILNTLDPRYIAPNELTMYNDGFLCSGIGLIYELDNNGNLTNAYQLDKDHYFAHIATNGSKIWALYEEHGPTAETPSVLYELRK